MVSYYKVNESKSNVLNVVLDTQSATKLKKQFEFTWSPSAISYLGIQLTANVSNLFHVNYESLCQSTRLELEKISHYYLLWSGRLALFKMLTLYHPKSYICSERSAL